jgi:hypothetical protein
MLTITQDNESLGTDTSIEKQGYSENSWCTSVTFAGYVLIPTITVAAALLL